MVITGPSVAAAASTDIEPKNTRMKVPTNSAKYLLMTTSSSFLSRRFDRPESAVVTAQSPARMARDPVTLSKAMDRPGDA
jgi:hypothetical protein